MLCQSESCLEYPSVEDRCDPIEEFVAECNAAEVTVEPWRTESFCGEFKMLFLDFCVDGLL